MQYPWLKNIPHPTVRGCTPEGRVQELLSWLKKQEEYAAQQLMKDGRLSVDSPSKGRWLSVFPVPHFLNTRLGEEPKPDGSHKPLFARVTKEEVEAVKHLDYFGVAQAAIEISKLRLYPNQSGKYAIPAKDIDEDDNGTLIIRNASPKMADTRLILLKRFFEDAGYSGVIHEDTTQSVDERGQVDYSDYPIFIDANKIVGITPGKPWDSNRVAERINAFVTKMQSNLKEIAIYNKGR